MFNRKKRILELEKELKKCKSAIRNTERRLLAFENLVEIDIDASVRPGTDTTIVIASRLRGGSVNIIDMRIDNYSKLMELTKNLKHAYKPYLITFDAPRPILRMLNEMARGL